MSKQDQHWHFDWCRVAERLKISGGGKQNLQKRPSLAPVQP